MKRRNVLKSAGCFLMLPALESFGQEATGDDAGNANQPPFSPRSSGPRAASRPSRQKQIPSSHVAAAVRYMRKNYHLHICPEIIAQYVGISRSLLDRDFKVELGLTVSNELREIRFTRIRHLLLHTDLTIKVIALQTGFSNDVSLSHFFKASTGITPGAFRRNNDPKTAEMDTK